jgi:hypothetical protein
MIIFIKTEMSKKISTDFIFIAIITYFLETVSNPEIPGIQI